MNIKSYKIENVIIININTYFLCFGNPNPCLRVAVGRSRFSVVFKHAFLKKGVLWSRTDNIRQYLVNI